MLTFPLTFPIGPLAISAHLVFEVLAFFVGFRYFLYLRKRQSDAISDGNRVWILIGAAFGAFLFSRLIGSLEDPFAWSSTPHPLFYFYSNKTIVGALLGGLLCVELMKMLIGEQESSGDLFTFPLILAMIIGRIGCFSMGVHEATYGIATTLPWGMNLGDGISRHPVALYEILFLVCLWSGLVWLEKKRSFQSGIRFQFFLIAYLSFRFLLEFIKPGFIFFIPLTTIQMTCMAGLLYYHRTIYRFLFRPTALLTSHASES